MNEDYDRNQKQKRRGRPPAGSGFAEVIKLGRELSVPTTYRSEFFDSILAKKLPNWSDKTLELLTQLTPLERGMVEWMTTGCTVADAYRIASNRVDFLDKNANSNAYDIARRPHVKEALDAALGDRHFGARYDREFKLQYLGGMLARLQESTDPADIDRAVNIIKLMSLMQGEIVRKQETTVLNSTDGRSIHTRITEILRSARSSPAGLPNIHGDSSEAADVQPLIKVVNLHQPEALPAPPLE